MKVTIEFKEDGTMKKLQIVDGTKKLVDEGSNHVISMYGRTYDSTNPFFEADMEYNTQFVKMIEQICDLNLKTDGVLILNDVYDLLGYERTKLGAVTGWTYNKGNPDADNHVYFDVIVVDSEEPYILLDFNVDGIIMKYLKD